MVSGGSKGGVHTVVPVHMRGEQEEGREEGGEEFNREREMDVNDDGSYDIGLTNIWQSMYFV